MKIGLYISELLQDYDCVVFPGFGAFTVHAVEAKFDQNTGKLLPPSREIRFNPDIKVNDGILLNHFAQRQEIAAPKAFNEIESLYHEINYRFDHGETIRLEGLGSIKRYEGKIIFEAIPEMGKMPESFGLEPVELKVYDYVDKKPLPDKVVAKSDIPTTRNPKRKNLCWLSLIPVLVSAIFIFWFFGPGKQKEQPGKVVSETTQSVVALPQVTDTIPEPESDDISSEKETVEVQVHPQEGMFYLVGGSFKTRENAEQYFEQISKKGYEPVHLGEMGSFHVVAMAVYPSEREAINAQSKVLRQDSTSGAWVYYIPGLK
jgi:nucleoid DNA-binding protein